MQQPIHTLTQPGARWTTERWVGVGFVGILHVIAISAILAGLTPTITRFVENPIKLIPVSSTKPPPEKTVVRVKENELPTLPQPVNIPEPTFKIAPEKPDTIPGSSTGNPPQQTSVSDTFASGVGNTHTVPSYPPLARRLGEQGGVRLSLTISASGDVTGATVVQSSGFPDLDQLAVDWVTSHWKYKPATHAGVAVPGQTVAMVVFNLQNAR